MVLNEGLKMRRKVVIANFFTLVGYPVKTNSKAIAKANGSTETYLYNR